MSLPSLPHPFQLSPPSSPLALTATRKIKQPVYHRLLLARFFAFSSSLTGPDDNHPRQYGQQLARPLSPPTRSNTRRQGTTTHFRTTVVVVAHASHIVSLPTRSDPLLVQFARSPVTLQCARCAVAGLVGSDRSNYDYVVRLLQQPPDTTVQSQFCRRSITRREYGIMRTIITHEHKLYQTFWMGLQTLHGRSLSLPKNRNTLRRKCSVYLGLFHYAVSRCTAAYREWVWSGLVWSVAPRLADTVALAPLSLSLC